MFLFSILQSRYDGVGGDHPDAVATVREPLRTAGERPALCDVLRHVPRSPHEGVWGPTPRGMRAPVRPSGKPAAIDFMLRHVPRRAHEAMRVSTRPAERGAGDRNEDIDGRDP